jgi:hypothetical protein
MLPVVLAAACNPGLATAGQRQAEVSLVVLCWRRWWHLMFHMTLISPRNRRQQLQTVLQALPMVASMLLLMLAGSSSSST